MRILLIAAKKGTNVLLCMANTTKCILLASVMQHRSPRRDTVVAANSSPVRRHKTQQRCRLVATGYINAYDHLATCRPLCTHALLLAHALRKSASSPTSALHPLQNEDPIYGCRIGPNYPILMSNRTRHILFISEMIFSSPWLSSATHQPSTAVRRNTAERQLPMAPWHPAACHKRTRCPIQNAN
jgi:hypothetical protein